MEISKLNVVSHEAAGKRKVIVSDWSERTDCQPVMAEHSFGEDTYIKIVANRMNVHKKLPTLLLSIH